MPLRIELNESLALYFESGNTNQITFMFSVTLNSCTFVGNGLNTLWFQHLFSTFVYSIFYNPDLITAIRNTESPSVKNLYDSNKSRSYKVSNLERQINEEERDSEEWRRALFFFSTLFTIRLLSLCCQEEYVSQMEQIKKATDNRSLSGNG